MGGEDRDWLGKAADLAALGALAVAVVGLLVAIVVQREQLSPYLEWAERMTGAVGLLLVALVVALVVWRFRLYIMSGVRWLGRALKGFYVRVLWHLVVGPAVEHHGVEASRVWGGGEAPTLQEWRDLLIRLERDSLTVLSRCLEHRAPGSNWVSLVWPDTMQLDPVPRGPHEVEERLGRVCEDLRDLSAVADADVFDVGGRPGVGVKLVFEGGAGERLERLYVLVEVELERRRKNEMWAEIGKRFGAIGREIVALKERAAGEGVELERRRMSDQDALIQDALGAMKKEIAALKDRAVGEGVDSQGEEPGAALRQKLPDLTDDPLQVLEVSLHEYDPSIKETVLLTPGSMRLHPMAISAAKAERRAVVACDELIAGRFIRGYESSRGKGFLQMEVSLDPALRAGLVLKMLEWVEEELSSRGIPLRRDRGPRVPRPPKGSGTRTERM